MSDASFAEGNLIVQGPSGTALKLGTGTGLAASRYQNNVISKNGSPIVEGGVDMGGNLCNGSPTCP